MTSSKDFLNNNLYMNIATVDEKSQPWNTPVFFVHKNNLLYWFSNKDSIHSQNISNNGKVFITMYDSTLPEGKGVGLYVLAQAEQLPEQKIEKGIELYNAKAKKYKIYREFITGNSPNRMYCAKILKTWVNSEGEIDGVFVDIRKEIK